MMLIQHFVLLKHISSVEKKIFLIQLYDKADACDDYMNDEDDYVVEEDDYVHFVQEMYVDLMLLFVLVDQFEVVVAHSLVLVYYFEIDYFVIKVLDVVSLKDHIIQVAKKVSMPFHLDQNYEYTHKWNFQLIQPKQKKSINYPI